MTPARDPKQHFWKPLGKHLGAIWEAFGSHLGSIWELEAEEAFSSRPNYMDQIHRRSYTTKHFHAHKLTCVSMDGMRQIDY